MKRKFQAVFSALALLGALLFCTGADHREAPAVLLDPAADINDIYAWMDPNVPGNVVLAMTVNPFTAPGNSAPFATDVMYQFKIDNDGDLKEDLVVQFLFQGNPGVQTFTLLGPGKPRRTGTTNMPLGGRGLLIHSGPANATVTPATPGADGFQMFCGMRDDPFFFDSAFFNSVVNSTPLGRAPGVDFFGGHNVSIMVVTLPADLLTNGGSDTDLLIWGTTNRQRSTSRFTNRDSRSSGPYVQIDRMGRPAIATALIPSARRNEFNRGTPDKDFTQFGPAVNASLLVFNGGDTTHADNTTAFLMPDVLNLDTTALASGFPDGRRPEDDVIDVVLSVATNGGLTTDDVDANDFPFLMVFPYFGTPIPGTADLPPRQ